MDQNKIVKRFVIATFVTLYALVSVISTIHVIDFFEMSNPYWLAVSLAIGFEVGAAASLASLVILDKMNKTLVWALFITITLMQMQGNMFYAFQNLENFQGWIELFDLVDEELLYQKRILALVSGAILPLVALGFIKSLIDYIKPQEDAEFTPEDSSFSNIEEPNESEPVVEPENTEITEEESEWLSIDLDKLDELEDEEWEDEEWEDEEWEDEEWESEEDESEEDELEEDELEEDELEEDELESDIDWNVQDKWDDDEFLTVDERDEIISQMEDTEPVDEVEEFEEPNDALKNAANNYKREVNNPTSVAAVVNDPSNSDLLEEAKRKLALEKRREYVNSKKNA